MTASMDHDPTVLPPNLPIPEDDGAAAHLLERVIPRVRLRSTEGREVDLAELATRPLVLYVYPSMGRPGEDPLPGWDATPGARGCTPQTCAFRDHNEEFVELGYFVAGLSGQPLEEQKEASRRLRLSFPLFSDPSLELAGTFGLPTFEVGGMTFYKRLTLVAREGRVVKVFYPVFPPDENAAEVLTWLRVDHGPGRP